MFLVKLRVKPLPRLMHLCVRLYEKSMYMVYVIFKPSEKRNYILSMLFPISQSWVAGCDTPPPKSPIRRTRAILAIALPVGL